MAEIDPCEVCTAPDAKTLSSPSYDGIQQSCQRCGKFKITGSTLAIMRHGIGKEKRAKISGWIRDQNRVGSIPTINSSVYKSILARPIPSVAERARRLLVEAAHEQTELGATFNFKEPRFLAATYSSNDKDLFFLTQLLARRGQIENQGIGGKANISPEGYIELDELIRHPSSSMQGFVAMWFDSGLDETYNNGFQKGIMDAGYNPVRIDRVEHINKIDDEIIAQINTSRFVVADFTGHRGGVYFEAGYALGLNLPVFWSCRKDHLNDLHFDIRQFNCIDWETPEELAKRLSKRIEAVLGKGVQL